MMSRYLRFGLIIAFVGGILWPLAPSARPVQADDPTNIERVDQLMATLTLEQKVGQLFMVSFFSSQLLESSADFIRDYYPGAIALFGSNVDYQSPAQTTTLINTMQTLSVESSGVPMIIAIDQEGGRVWRLVNGFTHFPPPTYLAATENDKLAFAIGQAMGAELGAVGVNMNLSPVVDLMAPAEATNPRHVLFQRTMGSDPETVGQLSGQLAAGMAAGGAIGVVKHYPGHSPTDVDSHHELPTISIDRDTFEQNNLEAFRMAIENGAEVVMVGHLYYPAIEGTVEELPASLSPTMLGILRNDLDFEGVIMTDALDMGAIQTRYTAPTAAVMAIQAGADLLAMGPNMPFRLQKESVERVRQAVQTGEISAERFDEAVRHVLLLKAHHGLLDWQPLVPASAESRIPVTQSSRALEEAFEAGITLVYDDQNFLPIDPDETVAIIRAGGWSDITKTCTETLPNASVYIYNYEATPYDVTSAATLARNVDKVIVFAENLFANSTQRGLIETLPAEKTIFVSMGTPYDLDSLVMHPAAYMVAYSSLPEAQRAVCRVLAGQVPTQGRLPVTLRDYPIRTGIQLEARPQ